MCRSARGGRGWRNAICRGAWVLAAAAGPAWGDDDVQVTAMGPAAHGERTAPRLALTLTPPVGAPGVEGRELGLRWRQALDGHHAVDITAWQRTPQRDALSLIRERDPSYGARVELRIAPARSRFIADYRFLGLQLDNGGRISLRRKDGRAAITYRQQV